MRLNSLSSEHRYQAFVSYCHKADELIASALQRTLEKIACPWYRVRSLRVFRDDTDLSVAPELETEIFHALEQSAWLVLLASPQSAESIWVSKEVQWWLTHRTVETILLVKTEGEIQWDSTKQDFNWSKSNAIPTLLRQKFKTEPLFADLSRFKQPELLDTRNSEFRAQVLKIAARLFGKSPIELESEDLQQVRRNKVWATFALLATVCGLGVAIFAWQVAERRADQLEEAAILSRSNELAVYSRELSISRNPDVSFVLARHSLATDKDNPQGIWSTWSVMAEHLARQTFRGDRGSVLSAVFSPDGRWILSANADRTAQLWNVDSGTLINELRGHQGAVTSAVFSPDGRSLLTTSKDHTARVWDAANGDEIIRFIGHTSGISQAIFSPDGQRIATASHDGTACVWSVASGDLISKFGDQPGAVSLVAFSPNGSQVLTSSMTVACVWEADSGNLLATFRGHKEYIYSARFSPDGKRIVTVSRDHTSRVWDVTNESLIAEFSLHRLGVYSAEFSPDGKRVLTACVDGTVRIFEISTGKVLTVMHSNDEPMLDARFNSNGSLIVTRHELAARLWDVDSQTLIAVLRGHQEELTSAAFSQDSKRVVTASHDGTVRVWNVNNIDTLAVFSGNQSSAHRVAFSSNAQSLLVANENTVQSWELANQRLSAQIHGTAIAFSQDGRFILMGSMDGRTIIWDTENKLMVAELSVGAEEIITAAFTEDSKRIVVSTGRTASVWEVSSGDFVVDLRGHENWIESAIFDPDGERVLTAIHDGTARIWDAWTGGVLVVLEGHGDALFSAVFSSDGQLVVTASEDWTSRVWEATTGKVVSELLGHKGAISSANFSPDGQLVVTVSKDATVRLWDAKNGRKLAELSEEAVTAAFSPDGSLVVTSGINDIARVWDTDSRKLILELRNHLCSYWPIVFSPNGRLIAAASRDGSARIWNIEVAYADATELIALLDQRITRLDVKLRPDQCQRYFSSMIGTRPAECIPILENRN